MLENLSKLPSYFIVCIVGLCFYPIIVGVTGVLLSIFALMLALIFIGIVIATPFIIAQTCWELIFK